MNIVELSLLIMLRLIRNSRNRYRWRFREQSLQDPKNKGPNQDLTNITRTKGQVGKMSIEDVILAIGDVKGDSKKGEILFTKQGCVACHTLRPEETLKDLGSGRAILS